jgi:catechol 2,3-dioxygenase-like lactoylglutathione lyase family enzyme
MRREAGLRLELFVLDMELTIAFYTRMLAFELARHELGDYASLRLGGIVLGIGPVAKLPEEGGYFGRDIATLPGAWGWRSSWRWTTSSGGATASGPPATRYSSRFGTVRGD